MTDYAINFPEKYYVGIQGMAPRSTTEYPLGFATPYGTDSAFAKRKQTVDDWCGTRKYNYQTRQYEDVDGVQPTIIDNVPVEGFQLEKVVSRWQTSNKMFRVNDPRGFTLEIDTFNLCDLLLNCTVDHGQLVGKFIWGRKDGKNFLTRLSHPAYQESLEEKINRKTLQRGDVVRLGADKLKFVFVGKYYIIRQAAVYGYKNKNTGQVTLRQPDNYYDYSRYSSYAIISYSYLDRDPKPWLYFKCIEDANNIVRYKRLRSLSKFDIISENYFVEDIETGKFGKFSEYREEALFESKEQMLNFVPDSDLYKSGNWLNEDLTFKQVEVPVTNSGAEL